MAAAHAARANLSMIFFSQRGTARISAGPLDGDDGGTVAPPIAGVGRYPRESQL
jgi:hypothetical protein